MLLLYKKNYFVLFAAVVVMVIIVVLVVVVRWTALPEPKVSRAGQRKSVCDLVIFHCDSSKCRQLGHWHHVSSQEEIV